MISLFENISKKLSEKRNFMILLVFCAVLVGFLNVFPDILTINKLAGEGKAYYPYSFGMDETYVAGPRLREVLDGHLIVSDINIYEYKNYPPLWLPLPLLFQYPILKITSSVALTASITNFLFPALIFLLLFCLGYVIAKRKFLSLFFALFFSLYHEASIHMPPFLMEHFKKVIKMFIPFNVGDNIVASVLTSRESFIPCLPILLLAIIFLYLNYKYDKKIYIVLFGLFYGLNAYTYPFHFIFLSSAIFVLVAILLIQKKWDIIKRFIFSFLISLLVMAPFFYIQIKLRLLPQYYDIIGRQGMEISHRFRFSYWKEYLWYLIVSWLVFWWGKKTNKQEIAFFITSFVLAGILVLNMQVIFGFNLQPRHWEVRTIFLGLSLAWLVLFWQIEKYFEKRRKKIFIAVIAVLICLSLTAHLIQAFWEQNKTQYQNYTIPEYMQKSFSWLGNNTEKESVVASPLFSTITLIPTYTHNNIFIPLGINSFAPEDEIIERLIINYKLFGVSREQLDNLLNPAIKHEYKNLDEMENRMSQVDNTSLYLFCYKYVGDSFDLDTRYAKNETNLEMPEDVYKKIMEKFDNFDIEKEKSKYRLDYLYLGPREKKISTADFSKFEKIYDNQGVEIYRYK